MRAVVAPVLSFIDGSLLRFRPFNAIAQIKRINRPAVIFTNQHRSYWRLLAGGSGFDYMRDGQKKKKHECCAAHCSFISTHILRYDTSDEERERWSRPVDLVH